MRYIHFTSPFRGSLNEVTEGLISGLKGEYIITREGLEEPLVYDILISHFITPKITKSNSFYRFKDKILIQPVDGTVIKKDVIEAINKYDLIITPAEVGKTLLKENGVYKKIEVIPNYFKKDLFEFPKPPTYEKIKSIVGGSFVFYHESTCHPRKGVEEMLIAYVKAFSSNSSLENVVLILKTPPYTTENYNSLEEVKSKITELQSSYKYPAKIIKISQNLSFDKLKSLWYICDCYVHTAKIEGFGIPLLRMSVLEKDILTLDNNLCGYMDFINKDKSELVKCNLEYAEGEINPIFSEMSQWKTPIEKSLIKGFKDIRIKKAFSKRKRCKKNYSKYLYENIIKEYKRVIESLGDYLFLEGEVKSF